MFLHNGLYKWNNMLSQIFFDKSRKMLWEREIERSSTWWDFIILIIKFKEYIWYMCTINIYSFRQVIFVVHEGLSKWNNMLGQKHLMGLEKCSELQV